MAAKKAKDFSGAASSTLSSFFTQPAAEPVDAEVKNQAQTQTKTKTKTREISARLEPDAPRREDEVRYKRNPEYIEVRTKRLQILVSPSQLARVKRRTSELGIAVSEYVNRLIDSDIGDG